MTPHTCYLTLGSNTDAASNMTLARHLLEQYVSEFKHLRFSPLMQTQPVGQIYAGTQFLNQVVSFTTSLSATEVTHRLKETEVRMGRKASDKQQGKVIIDIDLIVFDSLILKPADYARTYFTEGMEALLSQTNEK